MTKDETLKLALEALESSRVFVTTREKIKHPEGTEWYDERIAALRERLAKPEREHLTDGQPCWCGPEVTEVDPVTGASVVVHKDDTAHHAEQLARLGWQYFECPACGSEGARAFPVGSPIYVAEVTMPDPEDSPGYTECKPEQEYVPVKDNTYGYAKSLAEAIFKQHFSSDEHYASGRIVWGVNDTVIGILTQIDNMVADMVRRPPHRKPLTDEMVVAAARILSDRRAAECNVDCGDMWKMHGNDFLEDVRAALEAAHGIKE